MDFFQGIVADYLRADRSCFINPEFFLANDLSEIDQDRKKFWYVDVLAIQTEECCAYLCEVTYAKPPTALLRRLKTWNQHWPAVCAGLYRDAGLPPELWEVRPWLFVPSDHIQPMLASVPQFTPAVKITPLEMTLPWKYHWNRKGETKKPDFIPVQMQ